VFCPEWCEPCLQGLKFRDHRLLAVGVLRLSRSELRIEAIYQCLRFSDDPSLLRVRVYDPMHAFAECAIRGSKLVPLNQEAIALGRLGLE
jgi:hypothetical protein